MSQMPISYPEHKQHHQRWRSSKEYECWRESWLERHPDDRKHPGCIVLTEKCPVKSFLQLPDSKAIHAFFEDIVEAEQAYNGVSVTNRTQNLLSSCGVPESSNTYDRRINDRNRDAFVNACISIEQKFRKHTNTKRAFNAAVKIQRWFYDELSPRVSPTKERFKPTIFGSKCFLKKREAGKRTRYRQLLHETPALAWTAQHLDDSDGDYEEDPDLANDPRSYVVRNYPVCTEYAIAAGKHMIKTWVEESPNPSHSRAYPFGNKSFWDWVATKRDYHEFEKKVNSKPIEVMTFQDALSIFNGTKRDHRERLFRAELDEGCILWEGSTRSRGGSPVISQSAEESEHHIQFQWCNRYSDSYGRTRSKKKRRRNTQEQAEMSVPRSTCSKRSIQNGDGPFPQCGHGVQPMLHDALKLGFGVPEVNPEDADGTWLYAENMDPSLVRYLVTIKRAPRTVATAKKVRPNARKKIGVIPVLLNLYRPDGFRMLNTNPKNGYKFTHTCGKQCCINPHHIDIKKLNSSGA